MEGFQADSNVEMVVVVTATVVGVAVVSATAGTVVGTVVGTVEMDREATVDCDGIVVGVTSPATLSTEGSVEQAAASNATATNAEPTTRHGRKRKRVTCPLRATLRPSAKSES
jgi:hypothetical protein